MWTGGSTYNYPEFNCCACGKGNIFTNYRFPFILFSILNKGWPLWFVPASGYKAEKAIPEERVNMTYSLMCADVYNNASACTMKCKALPDNLTVTTLAMMNGQDFNQATCTLDLNMQNNSLQYIIQIPTDNYLMYFANWTTNQYNFSCINSTGLMTSNMLCRYDVDGSPIQPLQCVSNNITNRYIPPGQCIPIVLFVELLFLGCVDTVNWRNPYNYTCFEYEITQRWCKNGKFTAGNLQTIGPSHSYPERNCCACGKGTIVFVNTF
jgi:hypothetical protein